MPSFNPRAGRKPPADRTHVTFVDHSGTGIALPHKDLLRLHAALAHVLHLSGAAGILSLVDFDDGSGAGQAGGIKAAGGGRDFVASVVEGEGWREAELSASVAAMFKI